MLTRAATRNATGSLISILENVLPVAADRAGRRRQWQEISRGKRRFARRKRRGEEIRRLTNKRAIGLFGISFFFFRSFTCRGFVVVLSLIAHRFVSRLGFFLFRCDDDHVHDGLVGNEK